MPLTVYKIRRNSDGLFSTGGPDPTFTTKGKAWSGKGSLHLHLSQFRNVRVYEGCEIVGFEYVETGTRDIQTAFDEIKADQDQREAAYQERLRKDREERDRAQLRHLRTKYSDEE